MKNKIFIWFKKHYIGLILALLFGLFSVGPQLLFLHRASDDFNGIYGEFNGDALYYLSRVQEVLDGYPATNNSYLLEHKDSVYAQTSFPENIIALISKITNLNPPELQVVLDFILPFSLSLFTYLLFFKFSKSRLVSSLLVVIFFFVSLGPMNKPINPQISFFFLLSFLYLFYNFIHKEKKIIWSLLLGINLGLLFNIYFYHWSFLFTFGGIYFLVKLIQKDYREFKYLPYILIPAFLIGIPYFYTVYLSVFSPVYGDTSLRVGMYLTHGVESYPRTLVGLFWVILFIIFSFRFRLFKDKKWPFFFALILGNIVYPNQQIITGRVLQLALHWSWMPIFIFCITTCYFYYVLKDKNLFKKENIIFSILIILFLLTPVVRLSTFSVPASKSKFKSVVYLKYQRYGWVVEWLNDNTEKDEVVYTNLKLSHIIPAYTHNNVFYDNYIFNLPASDKEVIERYLIANWLNEDVLSDENYGLQVGEQLLWNFAHSAEQNVHRPHRFFNVPYEEKYSIEKEVKLIKKVHQELKSQDFIELLTKYRIDYIIWDEEVDEDWQLDKKDKFEKIFKKDKISIWKIKK